jgi:hypothetical protein
MSTSENPVKVDLRGLSHMDKIAALAAKYEDLRPWLDISVEDFRRTLQYAARAGIPANQTWAAATVSAAESMDLDLDTTEGLGVAMVLAQLQMRLV